MEELTEDIQWQIDSMRAQGWEVEECSMVKIPVYESVRAGYGYPYADDQHELEEIPMQYVDGTNWMVTVKGESMRDFNLREGDHLLVRAQSSANSNDIVVAHYDGAPTVKAYIEDADGCVWLVPGNEDYPAVPTEGHDVRIFGVVMKVIHERPLADFKSCSRSIQKAKRSSKRKLSNKEIASAIRQVLPEIRYNRQWFCVYAVLREVKITTSYTSFAALLGDIMGEDAPDFDMRELSRVDSQSFKKPIALWDEENAPISGATFRKYLSTAKSFQKYLFGAK